MAIKNIGLEKYKITIELGNDLFARRRRKVKIFNGSLEAARKEEASLMAKYYHGLNTIKTSDLTFREFSELFIEKYCQKEVAKITTKGYTSSLKRINPIIGDLKLNKITPFILDNMYEKLRVGLKGTTLGYHSQYSFYKLINLMFNTAVRWEIMDRNPNDRVIKPKNIPKEKNYYNLEQVREIISVLEYEPIKYRTLIHLALDSGCRRAEICGLRWSDINFETKEVYITRSLKVINGVVDEKSTKTVSSIRRIILSDGTIELLKDYRKWQEEYKKSNSKNWKSKDDRVFTSKDGSYMHPDTCSHIINKITKKYNLDPVSFHELRHTCASVLVNQGIDIKTISSRMGHAKSSTTLDIYTHSFDSAKVECANKMEEVLKPI